MKPIVQCTEVCSITMDPQVKPLLRFRDWFYLAVSVQNVVNVFQRVDTKQYLAKFGRRYGIVGAIKNTPATFTFTLRHKRVPKEYGYMYIPDFMLPIWFPPKLDNIIPPDFFDAPSYSGKTTDSESVNVGSIPTGATNS